MEILCLASLKKNLLLGFERERGKRRPAAPLTHSLADSRMCPGRGRSPRPWRIQRRSAARQDPVQLPEEPPSCSPQRLQRLSFPRRGPGLRFLHPHFLFRLLCFVLGFLWSPAGGCEAVSGRGADRISR